MKQSLFREYLKNNALLKEVPSVQLRVDDLIELRQNSGWKFGRTRRFLNAVNIDQRVAFGQAGGASADEILQTRWRVTGRGEACGCRVTIRGNRKTARKLHRHARVKRRRTKKHEQPIKGSQGTTTVSASLTANLSSLLHGLWFLNHGFPFEQICLAPELFATAGETTVASREITSFLCLLRSDRSKKTLKYCYETLKLKQSVTELVLLASAQN